MCTFAMSCLHLSGIAIATRPARVWGLGKFLGCACCCCCCCRGCRCRRLRPKYAPLPLLENRYTEADGEAAAPAAAAGDAVARGPIGKATVGPGVVITTEIINGMNRDNIPRAIECVALSAEVTALKLTPTLAENESRVPCWILSVGLL